jgi:hypothetical protein
VLTIAESRQHIAWQGGAIGGEGCPGGVSRLANWGSIKALYH